MEGSSPPCRKLLPLACRFIQRDQWLIAHLDPEWKVKDVKRYLLAKCVGLPFIPPVLPAKSAPLDGTNNGGEGGRPSSPITFAPDPRFRPISPIQFASTSLPKGSVKANSIAEPGGDDGGEGYEEDDEWDGDDGDLLDDEGSHEGGGGLIKLGSSTTVMGTPITPANPRRFGHVRSSGSISSLGILDRERRGVSSASPNKPPSPLGLNSTTHENYTLLRFTTGQILEDDFHISWYELAPLELLELHPSVATSGFKECFENALILSPPPASLKSPQQSQTRILIPLPRHVSLKYIQPYWEGWVRALRVVYKDEFDYTSGAYNSYNKYGAYSASMLGPMTVAGTVEMGSVTGDRNHKEGGDVRQRRKTRLEWRERWVVIRDGIVSLSRDPQDTTPSHRMPLSSLTQLRGAEHLARSARTHPSLKSHGHTQSRHVRPSSAVNADREGRTEGLRPHDKPAKWDDLGVSARKNGESSLKPFSSGPPPPSSPREDARFHRHGNSMANGHGDPWSGMIPAESSSSLHGESNILRVRGGPDKRFDRSYLPYSREEAESAGMRVVCARFRTIKGSSKVSHKPAPRKEKETEGKQYTSTGPSLAMLAGGVGGSTGGGPAAAIVTLATGGLGGEKGGSVQPSRKDMRDREKEKQREKRREAEKVKAKSKHKELELGLFDELRGQYARKSSHPALGFGFTSSPANAGSSANPNGKSGLVSGFFGSPKEKKDKGKARKKEDEIGLSSRSSKMEREEQERDKGRDQNFSLGTDTGQARKPSDRGQGLPTNFAASVVEPAHSDGGNSDVVEEDMVSDITKHQHQYDANRVEASLEEEDRVMGSSQASSDDEPARDSENNCPSPLNRETSLPPITIPGSEVLSGSLKPDAHGGLDTAESSALSSPVFAHSTCSGSDSELSLGLGKVGKDRPSYRYGYRHDRLGKVDLHGEEKGEKSGPLPNPTEREGEGGDQPQPKEEQFSRAKLENGKESDRAYTYQRRKDDEHGEWIILDLGNEQAFTSILRIFHRHLSVPSSSSFISSVPGLSFERPTSPASPGRPLGGHPPFCSSTTLASQREVDEETPSTTRKRATSDAGLASTSHGAFSRESDADDDGDYFASSPFRISESKSRHPPILASFGVRHISNRRKPFEPLPYPEWRLEVVERAQAAGMGERGRPLDLILFGNRPSFQMDEKPEKRQKSLKSFDSMSRRSTVTTLSMRKPSHANDEETIRSDSDKKEDSVNYGSDDIIQVSDSEEEMSEVEWRGWMGDLHRQNRVRAQRDETAVLEAQVSSKARESDDSDDPPINPEAERRKYWQRKKDMEPCGVITSLYTSTALPGFVATSHEHHQHLHHQQHLRSQRSRPTTTTTLSSPSSNESLAVHRRGALSFGFSPVDISSASTSPPSSLSHHGHSHSQSQSFLGHHWYTGHSPLHHSTSMYAGLRNDPRLVQEPPPRRPSMPILTAEQTVGLLPSTDPLRMAAGKQEQRFVITERTNELTTPDTASPFQFSGITIQTPHSAMVSSSPAGSSKIPVVVTGEQEGIPCSSSSPATTPRRVSSAGLTGPLAGGSINHSTSVLSKGGLLRKKESDLNKDADKARKSKEKQDKAREKEERAKEKERAKEMEKEKVKQDASTRKLQRPKLSLATSSSSRQNLTSSDPYSSQVRSPTTMSAAKQILRRVKSGSSLKSGNEAASPAVVGPSSSKKKKPGALERIVRGLDSALDFADSRK